MIVVKCCTGASSSWCVFQQIHIFTLPGEKLFFYVRFFQTLPPRKFYSNDGRFGEHGASRRRETAFFGTCRAGANGFVALRTRGTVRYNEKNETRRNWSSRVHNRKRRGAPADVARDIAEDPLL